MKVIRCSGYDEMSRLAATEIQGQIHKDPRLWFCAATGYSPRGTYEILVEEHRTGKTPCDSLGIVKLDEWWGIPNGAEGSCEAYLKKELLSPLGISEERYIAFKSDTPSPGQECLRVQHELAENGPLDICVLGMGKNGHLALNEPAAWLSPNCHVSELASGSRQHTMLSSLKEKPRLGMTLGMADILQSKYIVLLVCGEGKQEAFEAFMRRKIDPGLPVSLLWLHPNTHCFLDISSFS